MKPTNCYHMKFIRERERKRGKDELDEFAITNNLASNNKNKHTKGKPRPSKQ
jgi:hypothetical protein